MHCLFFSVCIRGENKDDAVLCTDTATYELKAADTSNLLLLVPGLITSKSEGIYVICFFLLSPVIQG